MTISVPAKGWYVEVDHPSGSTLYPDVVGSPSRNPEANGYPRIEIPTRQREVWRNIDFENNDVPMQVWKDGLPQPIDRLETVDEAEGGTQVLKGRGGTELETRVRKEVDTKAAHLVAEEVISNNTPYAANVDTPATTTTTGVTIQTGDTQSEWTDAFDRTDEKSPILSTSDLSAGDGEGARLAQTLFFKETEDIGTQSRSIDTLISESTASSGSAVDLTSEGSYVENGNGHEHTIPESDYRVAIRYRLPDDPDSDGNYEGPVTKITVDGVEVGSLGSTDSNGNVQNPIVRTSDGYTWASFDGWDAGDLDPGNYSVRVEVEATSSETGSIYVDCITAYDGRWHTASAFDNSTDANGYLSSPTLYPTGNGGKPIPARAFEDVARAQAVTGGTISVSVDDSSGINLLGLSNDRGETYDNSGSGVSSYDVDFGDRGATLRWRVGLQGVGSRTTATPTQGFETPEVDTWTLDADLEDMPLVVDRKYDTDAMQILQDIAERTGDFIFEFRTAPDGTESVEWTVPGQRTTDRQPPVSSFESTRTVEQLVERVVIKGGSRQVTDEPFTASHGTFVDLVNDEVQKGQETVVDPDTGQQFINGPDYVLDALDGRIKTLSTGEMVDGQQYEISYQHKPKGSWTKSGAGSNPQTITRTLPQLPTRRACDQIARLIGEQLDEALEEAVVTIPSDKVGFEIVEAVEFDELPFEGDLEVREIENTPAETVMRLGSRESFSEIFDRIQARLTAVSEQA